jgi:protein AbiQ
MGKICAFEIRTLSGLFFRDYPNPPFNEIAQKLGRPYDVVIFECNDNYFVCVPFRSHIKHLNCYRFKTSKRSKISFSGLDYSKIAIISDRKYIAGIGTVDKDEYNEFAQNAEKIHNEVIEYVENYSNHVSGTKTMHPKMFDRRYRYATLKYFHRELKL